MKMLRALQKLRLYSQTSAGKHGQKNAHHSTNKYAEHFEIRGPEDTVPFKFDNVNWLRFKFITVTAFALGLPVAIVAWKESQSR
jgi:hypothetical protein